MTTDNRNPVFIDQKKGTGGTMDTHIEKSGSDLTRLIEKFQQDNSESLQLLANSLVSIFTQGGRLLIAATGNLQPIAQLTASHFTHCLGFERPTLPAITLGTDITLSTSLAHSGQSHLKLARHFQALGSENHLLLMFSDGSDDPALAELINISANGQPRALFSPADNKIKNQRDCTDLHLCVETTSSPRLLEVSLFCGNLLCELVEADLFGV
ncbi:MAG: hypothetical protein C0618_05970 [Desulfuromonas sp.]|nr:MAG: hypothetical protein C0618_05970 [Desulfuromonas sp.]